MSINDPPQGEPGTAIVIELPRPDLKEKEDVAVFQDAVFSLTGAVLVIRGKPVLDALLFDHKKRLSDYNAKLKESKIPLRIRLTHSTTVRGKKYVYCGRYIYGSDGKFHGKLDNAVLRNKYIREKWNEVGPPPMSPLDGFKYQVVVDAGMETNMIIVPYHLFIDQRFTHLFANFQRFRLGVL